MAIVGELKWDFAVKTDPASFGIHGVINHSRSERLTLNAPPGMKISKKSFRVDWGSKIGQDNNCNIVDEVLDDDEDVVGVTIELTARSGGGVGTRGSSTGTAHIGYRKKT